jgi:hypothetical protein
MVNTCADDVDTMVDNQPIVLPKQSQKMGEHIPQRQLPAPALWLHTEQPGPPPRTPETPPLSWMEHIGRVTPQKPRPAVPALREAEAAIDPSNVDMDQQMLSESAGDDSLPDVPLGDAPLPEARQDGSSGNE